MGNGLNRIGNTAAIPVRIGGTVAVGGLDLANTLLYNLPKEGFEVLSDTTKNIKDVLLGAWNHGKWYHKAMNIPLSPIIATGTAFEGAIRATVQPIINGVVNTWNTGVNTVKNVRRGSFGRVFSKKPISDFSYEHLKTKPLTLNNWFSKLQFARGKSGGGGQKEAAAVVAVADKKEEKSEKEKEKSVETKKENIEKNNDKKDIPQSDDEKNEEKNEEKNKDKKEEKSEKEKNSKLEEGYKQAEEILKDSKHGSKIYESIRSRIPSMAFVFDKSSSVGKIDEKTNEIIVGLSLPSDERQIAPLNTKKNSLEQTKHVLLHEMGHIMIGNNSGKAEKAFNISKRIFEKDKTTLTPLAQLGIYKTSEDKAKEDLSEMIALYANKNDNLDKYLSKLTSDKKEDEEYRKKFKLAKISKKDVDVIKNTCEELVKIYS